MYRQILDSLRESYNRTAAAREKTTVDAFKIAERQHFLEVLQNQSDRLDILSLLEIGAGTGKDGRFFQEHGLEVVCTDLSPEMVALCRSKGLNAHEMDFLHLAFPNASFDAIYALNCLLHVPKQDLPAVLQKIRSLLKPAGLFFMGVHGGHDFEGIRLTDEYVPKRFFAFYTDEGIQQVVSSVFEVLYFKSIPLPWDNERHFQSMILKARY